MSTAFILRIRIRPVEHVPDEVEAIESLGVTVLAEAEALEVVTGADPLHFLFTFVLIFVVYSSFFF